MPNVTLVGAHYSPWTLRARWALDHHRVRYRYREHAPMLGEIPLRLRRGLSDDAPVTVPVLIDGRRMFSDSLDIMRHADAVGAGAPLDAASPETTAFAEALQPTLAAFRVRVVRRTLRDPEALREAAAGTVPDFLAGWLRPVASRGARFMARKYGFDPDGHELPMDDIHRGLDMIRARVADGPYVGDRFSALDILAATTVQALDPLPALVSLAPATRRAWSDQALADRYADLVRWRDALWAKHSPHTTRSAARHDADGPVARVA